MKSKSPFANKSPLLAYKSDMRGNYANPKYVKEELVGVKIGEALTKAGTDIFSGLTTKPKSKSSDGSGSGGDVINNIFANGSNGGSGSNTDTDLNRRTEVLEEQGSGGFSGQSAKDLLGRNLTNKESDWKDAEVKRLGGVQQYRDYYKIGEEKDKFHTETTNEYETDIKGNERLISSVVKDLSNPISMKGSPNKLIGDTMDPYEQINPGAVPPNQAQNDLSAQPIISADGSQPSNRSIDMSAISDPYSALGADFGAGTRSKAQSIYGSAGQRQGLMNLGTPLHTEGHGGAKGHTHAKPGDYLDQTVAEDMGVNDIEDYEPIQKFKGKQMVVNLKKKDTIFSTNSTFVIPKHMEGITRSTEGTPSPKPVYINRNKKQ